jgi:hypothetical protein
MDTKKLAIELVDGLQDYEELASMAASGPMTTFWGDWSEARGIHSDDRDLHIAMQKYARRKLAQWHDEEVSS